ncbi:MAG: flavodoxin [Candidatus Adiutrix sp.]
MHYKCVIGKNKTNSWPSFVIAAKKMWRVAILAVIAAIIMPGGFFFMPQLQASAQKPNILIVYYSRTNNTEVIAKQIQNIVGGHMVRLETVDPYPSDYRATTRQAQVELNSGYKPPLKTTVDNIESYDVIFVGSPNWWNTIATPMMTFLSQNPLAGKTIVPFITHDGSRVGQSVNDIASFCPEATILEPLAVRGGSVSSAQNSVHNWLKGLALAQ